MKNYDKLIIRRNKVKDLFLLCNKEYVYFLLRYGQMIDNSLDYNKISDMYNSLEKK